MPLTSVVWLMKAFCSWEINPQVREDAQDRQGELLGQGWGTAVGATQLTEASDFCPGDAPLPPFPYTGIGLAFGFTKGSEGQDKLACMGFSFKTQPHKRWPGLYFPDI